MVFLVGVPTSEVDKFFLELYKWETFDYKRIYLDHPFSYGNMSVIECRILTGKKDEFGDDEGDFKIKLTLGPDHPDLIMWKVTWEYLKNSFYNDFISDVPWYRQRALKLKGWIRKKQK